MQYSMMIALSLFGLSSLAPIQKDYQSTTQSVVSYKDIVSYEPGNYIRSALFAEEIHHFDDLYLIHIIDGDVPIVIFCNRNYCYRPEDAERYV
jgi:hypothetical protein